MQFLVSILILIFLPSGWFAPEAQLDLARIISPQEGDSLQGTVAIKGTVTGIGFEYAEVSFRYQSSPGETWFPITRLDEPVVDDVLAEWDTTLIADETYQLKVVATYSDGHNLEMIIDNIHIHNYTPFEATAIPTITVTPLEQNSTAIPTIQATNILPTMTPLPTNELVLSEKQFVASAFQGAGFGVLLVLVIALWMMIRTRNRE